MQRYFSVITLVLLIAMVITRVQLLKRKGIAAFQFGKTDKRDFLIPLVAFLYIYLIVAHAFNTFTFNLTELFRSEILSWIGVACCLLALVLMFSSLVSFKESFRVGIDVNKPDRLITTGIFAFSRNPIYVSFGFLLLGQFLIFPNWVFLAYMAAGFWLFHRQVLSEERFLMQHYGGEYLDYSKHVRRYF